MEFTPDILKQVRPDDVERVKGPYTAPRFTFVYKDDFFPFREHKFYWIIIKKDKSEEFVDQGFVPLIPYRTDAKTFYGKYISGASNLKREIYLKPTPIVVTERMRENRTFRRYFAHYLFDTESTIFEITKQDYESKSDFYQKVSLDWTLVGSKETVKAKNEQALHMAEDTLTGMSYFLDPLEFYIEEISREEQVTGYLGRLKSAMESSTSVDRNSKKRKIRRIKEKAKMGKKKKSTSYVKTLYSSEIN